MRIAPRSSISPMHLDAQGTPNRLRAGLIFAGCAYLCFVIYGSLVPLQFRPMPIDTALEKFSAIPYLNLGIASRADWVANILLFIPLAYCWTGALWHRRLTTLRAFASVAVLLCCVALAIGIEFTQLFFPPRTVSINDVVAESIGSLAGIALWWLTGKRFVQWASTLPLARGDSNVAERLLFLYLFVLLGYNLLPLDLILSPVEIYHKWNEGRVLLLPFAAKYEDRAHQLYDLMSDIVIWVPVALLWKIAYRQPRPTVWLYVIAVATLIEFLQLFVYSRVTDTTDIITAALGGAIGVALARKRKGQQSSGGRVSGAPVASRAPWIWLALMVWLAVLATVYWYPFEFNFDRTFVRDRLMTLKRVPFEALYFGSEFRAVTEVLHKTGFMLPLGILLGLAGTAGNTRIPRPILHAAVAVVIVVVALGIEFGQLFLAGKVADLTDVFLESIGGFVGYCGYILTVAQLKRQPGRGLAK
jgi:VanZ family protein